MVIGNWLIQVLEYIGYYAPYILLFFFTVTIAGPTVTKDIAHWFSQRNR